MKKLFVLLIAILMFFSGIDVASASTGISSVAIRPYTPNDEDVLYISMYGLYDGMYYHAEVNSSIVGETIHINVQLVFVPSTWQGWWYAGVSLDPLQVGDYLLTVNLYANGQLVDVFNESVCIVPPSFRGWSDTTNITSNEVSDSFPTALSHNNLLYVFWNKSYGGTVNYMSYNGTIWTDQGSIADCKTASGIGAVEYEDKIFVFYSNGTYPIYHLFYTFFDGNTWSIEQQLTNGDVYDAYGATATVYNGLLYLFWKRWEPDGVRHIYRATFDSTFWSAPRHIVGDSYNNHPVTPVVFQDKLYLFYKHGIAYRVYDGSTWSDEFVSSNVPVLSGSEGSSPAALVSNDRLILFLLSDFGHVYRTEFNGSSWNNEERVTRAREDEFTILDMTAAMYRGDLYLIWGGIYSWPSNELYAKTFKVSKNSIVHLPLVRRDR